jgi:hypothetical protein
MDKIILMIGATEAMWPQSLEVDHFVSSGSPHRGQTFITTIADKEIYFKMNAEKSGYLFF